MENYLSKYFIEEIQKNLSVILVFCVAVLTFFYIYFINSSVLNTVAREQDNREIVQIIARISQLENSYIILKSAINIDLARSFGFKDDFSKVHFSSESTNVAGNISLLGNEI